MENSKSPTHSLHSLTNQFLVAMPSPGNDFFSNSITYICEHNSEGAMGVVVNQPLPRVNLNKIFKQMKLESHSAAGETLVLRGGPVNRQRGFVLHTDKGEWESTIHVADDIHLTSSKDIVSALAQGVGPKNMLFVLGYAGWEAGQLEAEIAANNWLTLPASKHILFDLPCDERWVAAAKTIGVDINLLSSVAGHA